MINNKQTFSNNERLDQMSVGEILGLMNAADRVPAEAVADVLPLVEQIVEQAVARFRRGGRWLFVGAGTSGRLAVMEAAECPPTFGLNHQRVIALMAGAPDSVFRAAEKLEDDAESGATAIAAQGVEERDCVIGLAASGRTPYVVGALREAQARGAFTGFVCAAEPDAVAVACAAVTIWCQTGPEVLLGSTRLKATTAMKMVTNMITTAGLVRLGRTFQNRMSHIRPGNIKLRQRAIDTLQQASGLSDTQAEALLERAGDRLAVAILSACSGVDPARAAAALADSDDDLNAARATLRGESPTGGAA